MIELDKLEEIITVVRVVRTLQKMGKGPWNDLNSLLDWKFVRRMRGGDALLEAHATINAGGLKNWKWLLRVFMYYIHTSLLSGWGDQNLFYWLFKLMGFAKRIPLGTVNLEFQNVFTIKAPTIPLLNHTQLPITSSELSNNLSSPTQSKLLNQSSWTP